MKIKFIQIIFVLVTWFYASFVLAGDYEKGVAAFNAGHDDQAFQLLKPLADNGNGKAQNFIGFLYSIGIGDNPSAKQAAIYYKLAAEQGYRDAQENLARQYLSGHGVEQSKELAIKWYEKAALAGSETAAQKLKEIRPIKIQQGFSIYDRPNHSKDENIPLTQNQINTLVDQGYSAYRDEDYRKSLSLWTKAAEAGDADAQANLSIMYSNGIGTEQNKEKVLYWLEKALAQDNDKAYFWTGKLHLQGLYYPKSKSKAYEFFQEAVKFGNIDALSYLAFIEKSWGGLQKAFDYYKQAAEAGDPEAQARLGFIYEGLSQEYIKANIVKVDLEKSMQWYLKAAQNDFQYAIYVTGYNYKTGRGVEKSLEKAEYWFKKCAKMGAGECLMSLNKEQQFVVKLEFYQLVLKKAKSGDAKAQFALSQLYKHGEGVEKSLSQTEYWLSKAAEQNYPQAMLELAKIYATRISDSQAIKKSDELYMKLAQRVLQPQAVVDRAKDEYNKQGNYKLAFALARPYADDGNKFAQLLIGKMYGFGRGVATSKENAEFYLLKAAEPTEDVRQKTAVPEAQYHLGFLYQYSYNNPQLAAKWYAKAAAVEQIDALNALALLYDMGEGVVHDKNKVIALYARAEAAGDKRAVNFKKTAQAELRIEQKRQQQQQLMAEKEKIKRLAKQAIEERKQAPVSEPVSEQAYYYSEPKKNKWSWSSLVSSVVNQKPSQKNYYQNSSNTTREFIYHPWRCYHIGNGMEQCFNN